ncbi:hypothetical protein FVEN_g10554 [Fusarium venenatum]|uniref:Fibroin-3 n=1 Tax=Fusarium venenatum TaxID=56646 RepID=A0A2L2SQQ6_9HYPO|nr:uncharacterized protein FVRRES_11842 [Fusarium venenatum]KAG8351426.1 hypothetical protein FVEN_g10554 [Fusarium venenatum]KAH6978503.1 hypothetical protein EDB82DRAFT_526602 [Fusarium venenatum]CEI39151.1 unnamed protein product [Fusarium venenatum]
MPSIDEAMARSLRGSAWEIVKDKFVRTIVSDLTRRDMLADAAQTTDNVSQASDDFATAISSWDNCMSVVWCKWPVIGVMILGGLIIFSILWCIIRCCCCGLSCCCSCCQCMKCCGNCCGACDPPGSHTKHLDDPYPPQPQHHGYRTEPPMNPSVPEYGVSKPIRNEPPQYAEYEISKKDDDALPEMPSSEGKKVQVYTEAVELDTFSKPPPSQHSMAGTPYSQPQGNSSGYLGSGQATDPYSPLDQQGYGYQPPPPNQVYAPAAIAPMPHERRSPALNQNPYGNQSYGHDQGFEQVPGFGQMQGHGQTHNYGQGASPQDSAANYGGYRASPSPRPAQRLSMHQDEFGSYGNLPPRRSPAIPDDYGYNAPVRHSPGPQNDFGYAQPPRQSPAPMNNYQTPTPGPEGNYGPRPVPQRQQLLESQSPVSYEPQQPYPGFKPYQP